MKNRLSLLALSVMLILSVALTACGGAAVTEAPAAPAAETAAPTEAVVAEPVTIKVMSFFAFDNPEVEQAVVAAFEAKYPEITVEFESVPMSDIFLKYKTLIAGNTGPDVMALNYENAYMFGAMGALEPLDEWMKKTGLDTNLYYKSTLDMFKVDGVQYSMPATFSDVVLFYNKDLFEAAGLEAPQADWTMEDVMAAGKTLTKDTDGDGKVDQFGYAFPWWPMVLKEYNAQIWDGKTCVLNSPEAIKAIQTVVDARYSDQYSPTAEQLAQQGDWDMFIAGKLAMFPTGPWAVQPFNDKISTFKWDIAHMPAGDARTTFVFANAYGISAASKQKEAAWKFVEFATGPEGTKIRQDGKYEISPVKEIAEKYFVAALAGDEPESAIVFMEVLEYAGPQPVHANWQEIHDAIWPELELAFSNSKPVADALNAACEGVNAILNR